jgi:hypothetical protein
MKDNRPHKKTEAFKTHRELQKVQKKQRKLGFYKLPEPRQKGWQSVFSVRADILLSSKANVFLQILPAIQHHDVSRKIEDFRIEGFRVQRKSEKNVWYDVGFSDISLRRKDSWNFPEYYWTKYFKLRVTDYSFYKIEEFRLHGQFERCFQSKIEPHMIYRIPIIDPSLESERKFLADKMTQNDYWKYICGNTDDGYEYEGYAMKQKELLNVFYKEIREELK